MSVISPPAVEAVNVDGISSTLAENAVWADQNRKLHPDTIAALGQSGVLGLRTPRRYGGAEVPATELVPTIAAIARHDGAAAWNTAVWSMCAWLAGLFPDHVQDEVFAEPDSLVCGVLSPTAQGRANGDDLVLDGRWHFISGALHSSWQVVMAMTPTPDGESMWPVLALVPMSDLTIEDDWDSAGLRGTGSVSTIADGVRVPMDRVLPLPMVLQDQFASQENITSPVWRTPMMPTGCGSFAGVAVGLAQAALSGFVDQVEGRSITYTNYDDARLAPISHLRAAESAYLAEEAEYHARAIGRSLQDRGESGEAWSTSERIRARAHLGRTFRLAQRAVDGIAEGSGGSSLYTSVPIQRIRRDVQALNLHALMHADTNAELYGRDLVGLEPNTSYL